MHYSQTAALFILLFVMMLNDRQYIQSSVIQYDSCNMICGINARCRTLIQRKRRVCSCYNLSLLRPLPSLCHRAFECLDNAACNYNRICKNKRCVDPCVGLCGVNTNCVTRNHMGFCQCLPGYEGDPFLGCQVIDPQFVCKQNPCGKNTQCKLINEVPSCTCLPDYIGSPFAGCRHECENDSECLQHLACSSSFRCKSPCKCGKNAECYVVNHRASCTCPKSWIGNPYVSCQLECTVHSECSPSAPLCRFQKCVNPCEDFCGVNANCNLYGITPNCSCPRHTTGNPFIRCNILFKPRDLCESNPCGTNAICIIGSDNIGKKQPVCICPIGYTGDARTSCQRMCFTDRDCPDNRACIGFTCSNPCTGHECGPNATCTPRHHIAECTSKCPQGTRGDSPYTCNPIESQSMYNNGRLTKQSFNTYNTYNT